MVDNPKKNEALLKILQNFRVTLPKEFRERFGLKVGDFVQAQWDGDDVLKIVPGKVIFKVSIKSEAKKEG